MYNQAGHRRQSNTAHALCMLIIKATDTQNMEHLLPFHDKNGNANASQWYVNQSLLVVFIYTYICVYVYICIYVDIYIYI
jgi:hypothetical protein